MQLSNSNRERSVAVAAVAIVHAALLYAFIIGLDVKVSRKMDDALKLFAVMPVPKLQPKPRPPVKDQPPRRKAEGAASAANLQSRAREVPELVPPIRIPVPPMIIVPPLPRSGDDLTTGSANVAGAGMGAGGAGQGTGAGQAGDGDGAGDGTPPRRIGGRIRDSDFPRDAAERGMRGRVEVRYRVGIDGRASNCIVTGGSGFPELDATTCRIIEERFRYAPALDEQGRPVGSIIVENHSWIIEH